MIKKSITRRLLLWGDILLDKNEKDENDSNHEIIEKLKPIISKRLKIIKYNNNVMKNSLKLTEEINFILDDDGRIA